MRTIPAWNPHQPQMPVDPDGNWLNWPHYNCTWEPVLQPFYAELKVDHMETGRSSKVVILKDDNGKRYPMFVSDMVKGVQRADFEVIRKEDPDNIGATTGFLRGWWTGSKRGSNYGIKAVKK